jgi:hypothetical protein
MHGPAERAYEWLMDIQLPDGSWWNYYLPDGSVEEAKLDTNVCAYIATGVWHHWLCTWDRGFVDHLWPTVQRSLDWVLGLSNVFLIRDPSLVVASYVKSRADVVPGDIGLLQQVELFDRVAQHLGSAPPVVDAERFLNAPETQLRQLCGALGVDFTPRMLSWPPGPRASDGVWAPHWYDAVWKSTGFEPWRDKRAPLPAVLQAVADACRPAYEQLLARAF